MTETGKPVDTVIEARDLSLTFDTNDGPVHALKDVWTCHGLVPVQVLACYAAFRSKAMGLLYPNAEWRRRGL